MSALIGILGGMGPLATVDFIQKIIDQTPAQKDQEHLPLLVHSVPQIPDRTACLMENMSSPLPALREGLGRLIDAGVGCIVIPCNTAHYWYDALTKSSSVPILHIAHACSEYLIQRGISSVGLMATDGTLKAGFYPKVLDACDIELVTPEPSLQHRIMEGIYHVKAGGVKKGGGILEQCMDEMLKSGVERVVLGCTEIPLALDKINSSLLPFGVDATNVLASACVRWHLADFDRIRA